MTIGRTAYDKSRAVSARDSRTPFWHSRQTTGKVCLRPAKGRDRLPPTRDTERAPAVTERLTIHVVPQQHWDPFWIFSPDVSETMGVSNLRKALDNLNEEPDFRYVLAQGYLWELFARRLPQRVDELKQRVREKKIELACGGYVNPDLNLPGGESLIRQLARNVRTFRADFGVSPRVGWIMDSFGQSGQLPQIFTKLGIRYHTAKRGISRRLPAVFVWQGVDGSRILMDRQPLGHHGLTLTPSFSFQPDRVNPDERLERRLRPFLLPIVLRGLYLPDPNIHTATKGRVHSFRQALRLLAPLYPGGRVLACHGFGEDGARPFPCLLTICRIYSAVSRNRMVVTTPTAYFEELEAQCDRLVTVAGELNGPTGPGEGYGAFPAVGSTRIEVKQRARRMEKMLYQAELLETLRYAQGGGYRDLTGLWNAKFLTDFHDGICGTLTDDNYLRLRDQADRVLSGCRALIEEDLRRLASADSLFNPLPWPRQDVVGETGASRLVETPGIGIHPLRRATPKGRIECDPTRGTLSTPHYRVRWGEDLEITREGVRWTGEGFAAYRWQKERGDTYFFDLSESQPDAAQPYRLLAQDPHRIVLQRTSSIGNTEIVQNAVFYAHTPRVDFHTVIVNREKDIRIQIQFPFSRPIAAFAREIPAGFIREDAGRRDPMSGQSTWAEVFGETFAGYDRVRTAQNWVYLETDQGPFAVFNEGLPEHEIHGATCAVTLLRCVGALGVKKGPDFASPRVDEEKSFFSNLGLSFRFARYDRYPGIRVPWRAGAARPVPLAQQQGRFEMRCAVCPSSRADVARQACEFLFPLVRCAGEDPGGAHRPFAIEGSGFALLAVKKREEGDGIVLRLLETEGRGKELFLALHPSVRFRRAGLADLTEEIVRELPSKDGRVPVPMGAQEIVTVVLTE